MKRIALLIAITAASLRAAPADKTLNLSVYSTSSGKFLNQAFTVSGNNGKVLGITGGAWALVTPSGGSGTGDALTTDPLSQFAATTSAQLRGVISDESGTGALLFAGGNIGAATATSLNGLTISTTTGTLTLANGKTLTGSNTLTFSGTDGSTLNIGAGGTLGAAALIGTSTGGNGAADNGKAVIFGTKGILDATTELTVHNSATAAHAYFADDATIGYHAAGETNPRELVFPTDVLENEAKEIATKDWVTANAPTGTVRKQTVTDASPVTITITADSVDLVVLAGTGTGAITIAAPTGTVEDGKTVKLRIKSTSARTLTFNSVFRFSTDQPAPTATSSSSLTDYFSLTWNATDSKWDVLGKNFGF